MWQLVVAAGISAASALYAQAQKAKGDAEKQKLLQQAADEISKVTPPDPEQQKAFFEQLHSQGVFTPEMEKDVVPLTSAYANISTDPRLKDAQMSSLSKLQELGDGGMNFEDKAALQGIQDSNAQLERGQRAAIMQNMAARGMSGSGQELASELANQQGAASRNANTSLNVAAQSQRRALDALQRSGELAGNLRGQDFGEQSTVAGSKDAIQRFNAANSISLAQRNVDRGNQAASANLSEQQRIADANVGLGNQQQLQHIAATQTGYDNRAQQAGAVAGAKTGMGNLAGERAKNAAAATVGVGNAVASGVNAYGNQQNAEKDRQLYRDIYGVNSDDKENQ